MSRVFIGHGNMWVEEELPRCSFCKENIDTIKERQQALFDAPFGDIQFCSKKKCMILLAETAMENEITELNEEN